MTNTTTPTASGLTDITGKVLPRRVPARDRSILALTYSRREAQDLRILAESITLKGDRKATMSTIARRALALYARIYASNPAGEVAALEAIVTQVPQAATVSKKKAAL
jgi:hypothetical protein